MFKAPVQQKSLPVEATRKVRARVLDALHYAQTKRIRWGMSFKEMIARRFKQDEVATRLSWFYRDIAVRYVNKRYDNTSFYIGHFPECTVTSDITDGDIYGCTMDIKDEYINADDWVIITKKELEMWLQAFKNYCGVKAYLSNDSEPEKEQSLIAAAIDNGLMSSHIVGSNSFDIDKEIK